MLILPYVARNVVREDWTDSGEYDGPYDNVSRYLKPSIQVERGRDQGRVTGGPKTPYASWTLTNESRLFSTVYSGSPLYGSVAPGHLVQIARIIGDGSIIGDDPVAIGDDSQVLGDGLVEMPVFTGRSEEPKERYGIGRRQVQFSAYGMSHDLVSNKISIPYQASITTGALVVLALQTAGLLSAQYVVDQDAIDNGRQLLHYYADSSPCWQILRTAWATEGPPAALFEDTAGRIVFWGRNVQVYNPRSTDIQVTASDIPDDTDTDVYFTDIDYEVKRSSVINDMAIDVEIKQTNASAQVWQYTGPLVLTGSQTMEIFARNTSGALWINVVTPVAPTDFTVSSGSLTSLTIEALSPTTVKITVVAGVGGATLSPVGANTGFSLRAGTVTTLTTVEARGTVDTTDSKELYGDHDAPSDLLSDVWRTISKSEADGLIDAYHVGYAAPREVATITLDSGNGSTLYRMMHAEVLDRWHIFDQQNGFDHDVFIGQLAHEITDGSQHKLVITAERVTELDWARWDVGRFDVDRFGN